MAKIWNGHLTDKPFWHCGLPILAVCSWLYYCTDIGLTVGLCENAVKEGYSSLQASLPSPLRELTCNMGSHSVTCHPAEVTFPPLPQPKLVLDLATPEGLQGWVDPGGWLEMVYPLTGHPSWTNRARCWLTSLMQPTTLTTTPSRCWCWWWWQWWWHNYGETTRWLRWFVYTIEWFTPIHRALQNAVYSQDVSNSDCYNLCHTVRLWLHDYFSACGLFLLGFS